MRTRPELARAQRWMQTVIMHPGDDETAIRSVEAQQEIPASALPELVLPSRTLTSLERLAIYREQYRLRLGEALEKDYPSVRHFLGQQSFDRLVEGYLQAYPSRSYTLNRLGDRFPAYILQAPAIRRRRFVHELALLEWAVTEVFDAAESPVLSAEDAAAVPPEAWATAVFRPVPAFRLLAFGYPVNAYLSAVQKETNTPPVRRKDTWVAVCRRHYVMGRLDLTRSAFEILTLLFAGQPLGEVLASRGISQRRLFAWFRDWVSAGIFQPVGFPGC